MRKVNCETAADHANNLDYHTQGDEIVCVVVRVLQLSIFLCGQEGLYSATTSLANAPKYFDVKPGIFIEEYQCT